MLPVAPSLLDALRDAAGADAVLTGDATAAFAADELVPGCAVSPASVEALERCLAAAHAAGAAVIPAGSGSRLGVGHPPARYDVAVSTRRLCRVHAHDAADLTVTVDAGVTLAELNAALASADQWLPLDPPRPDTATIGAIIATDACGPLRLAHGKARDHLIGITVVLADGTRVKGGGRVVKNVAGYDLMKLFVGSHGTLGIVAAASFKVQPRPAAWAALVIGAASLPAAVTLAGRVLAAPVAPLYVEALDRAAAAHVGLAPRDAVVVGLGGSGAEIDAQRERIRALIDAPGTADDGDAVAVHAALRDLPAAAVCGATVSLLPTRLAAFLEAAVATAPEPMATVAHAGSGVARLSWLEPCADAARFAAGAGRLRELATRHGGWLVFDTLPTALKQAVDPWGGGIPGVALMRGIKQSLDPAGRLCPGRFVDGM